MIADELMLGEEGGGGSTIFQACFELCAPSLAMYFQTIATKWKLAFPMFQCNNYQE